MVPGETLSVRTDGNGLFVMCLADEEKSVCAVAVLETDERKPSEINAWKQY